MDQKVIWSAQAEISMGRILDYLRDQVDEDYAERYLHWVRYVLVDVAGHPSKGMFVDRDRGIRRWRLDRHNYALYTVVNEGILVVDILPYSLNIKGF